MLRVLRYFERHLPELALQAGGRQYQMPPAGIRDGLEVPRDDGGDSGDDESTPGEFLVFELVA